LYIQFFNKFGYFNFYNCILKNICINFFNLLSYIIFILNIYFNFNLFFIKFYIIISVFIFYANLNDLMIKIF